MHTHTHTPIFINCIILLTILFFLSLDTQKNYQMLEVKQLRDTSKSMLHYMGVVKVDINGTLEEARESLITGDSCFVAKLRFLFLTRNLKLIHPKKESSLIVKKIQMKSIYLKILHGTGEQYKFVCKLYSPPLQTLITSRSVESFRLSALLGGGGGGGGRRD